MKTRLLTVSFLFFLAVTSIGQSDHVIAFYSIDKEYSDEYIIYNINKQMDIIEEDSQIEVYFDDLVSSVLAKKKSNINWNYYYSIYIKLTFLRAPRINFT